MKIQNNSMQIVREVIFAILLVFPSYAFSQKATANEPVVGVETTAPVVPPNQVEQPEPLEDAAYWVFLTPGVWAGENYFEGRLDALIPIADFSSGDGRLFLDLRGAWADEGEEELNLGLAFRRRCLPNDGILGINTFYDSRWTRHDSHFSQWGIGAEMLTEWVDLRANYYLPEHKQSRIGSMESVALAEQRYDTVYKQYAWDNQLREGWKRTLEQTWQRDTFDFYEYPLKGYDTEVGVKLPLNFDCCEGFEARLFLGYYNFEHRSPAKYHSGKGDISGLKGRFEVRGWNKLFFDVELYEDDDLFDSKFMVSARYRIPIGKDGPAFSGVISDRMSEVVMRDPHIQLRAGVDHQQTVEKKRTAVGSGDELLLDNVIFVHADRGGGPDTDGTGQRPYRAIQEGVDAAAQGSYDNVYVFGAHAHYRENVIIESGVNLWGEGHKFGHGYPGLGIAPVVRGNADFELPGAFNVMASEPVSITGFSFLGGTPTEGIPILLPLTGIFSETSSDLLIQENSFRNLLAGIYAAQNEESRVRINNNRFENVGAGILVSGSDRAETLVSGNRIEHALVGVLAMGLGDGTRYTARILGNEIVGNTSNIGGYIDPGFLTSVLMTEMDFEAFGMDIPTTWPIPSIAGIVVGAIDGARVRGFIEGNTVDGSLLGIVGLSTSLLGGNEPELGLQIAGNTLRGGGMDPLYQLGRAHAGHLANLMLGMIGQGNLDADAIVEAGTMLREILPETLGFDFGISGITLAALGDGASIFRAHVADNAVNDYVLGLGVLAIDGAEIGEVVIRRNTFSDNLIGTLGLALSDASIEAIGQFNNTFSDNLIGTLGLAMYNSSIGAFDVVNNRITGGGASRLLGLVDGVMGSGAFDEILEGSIFEGVSFAPGISPDTGLLGIGLVAYEGSSIDSFGIARNAIDAQAIGIGLLSFSNWNDPGLNDGTIANNAIGNVSAGILGFAEYAGIDNLTVVQNTISASTDDVLRSLVFSLLDPSYELDSTTFPGVLGIGFVVNNEGSFNNTIIRNNTINGFLWGIVANASGYDASLNGFLVAQNLLADNGVGIQMAGQEGAKLNDVILRYNTIENSAIGILAAISDDWYGEGSSMNVMIRDNTIVGHGKHFGLSFSAPGVFTELVAGSYAMHPDSLLDSDDMVIPHDFYEILPSELHGGSGVDFEDYFGANTSTEIGFAGIITSFQEVNGSSAVIRDNQITGFQNGIFVAVSAGANIDVRAADNTSSGNKIIGSGYTLKGSDKLQFTLLGL